MRNQESGFTVVELMIASVITMVVMGVAFSAFRDALALSDAVTNLADSTQNLRAGTNLLVRDLLQAGRGIDIGGLPIPSGPDATPVHRPSPEGHSYTFPNDDEGATLTAVVTGAGLGPTVAGRPTDMVTILMTDPFRSTLSLYGPASPSTRPRVASDGSSFDAAGSGWLLGTTADDISPIRAGDLIYFSGTSLGSALQTVTRTAGTTVYFEPGDPFNLNQRAASSGSITQILQSPLPTCNDTTVVCHPMLTAQRVYMYTYYVQEDGDHVPRLMRAINQFEAQALAGVIEDLELSYDLVDGVNNPTNVRSLPFTAGGVTFSENQIRKANVHVGVRSEVKSARTNDYLRNHLSTVIALRNLSYVDRYQ